MSTRAPVTLIGINDDGCLSLTSRAVNAVEQADVLAGAERHLAFFPQFRGERIRFGKLSAYLDAIKRAAEEQDVCVLASGDPLFFGLGRRLAEALPAGDLQVLPAPSSIQLAFARLCLPWDDAIVLSVHGRPMTGLVARLQQGDKFALLTDKQHHPQAIARYLMAYGETHWQLHVCERLGSVDEKVREFDVATLADNKADSKADIDPLNLMILQRTTPARWGGFRPHSPDDAYLKRTPKQGLITRQPIRALAVSNLSLHPEDIVWDIGAGSGSVAIEAAKQARQGNTFAIESNADCWPMIEENKHRHRVDHLQLIQGLAPNVLTDLPAPNAIFIGGSRGQLDAILAHCWQVLLPGGRLVLSAVTLDTVTQAFQWCQQAAITPQILLANIAQTAPLAHYTSYKAENPIHLFVLHKPEPCQSVTTA